MSKNNPPPIKDIMRILGIDPGLALCGFGIIDKNESNGTIKMIDYGVIDTKKDTQFPIRLKQIYAGITRIIEVYKPDCVAIEELFFAKNITTGIPVASARGVALVACINSIDNLFEYTPMQIKQALTGTGRADKKQVQYMVKAILNLKETPKPDDAADALAVAICHSQTNTFLSNTNIK